jgi:hypothetical protein
LKGLSGVEITEVERVAEETDGVEPTNRIDVGRGASTRAPN